MFSIINDNEHAVDTFFGNYRGQVISSADPLKAGRLQIRIYPMFSGAADSDLPWAIPADPLMGGIAGTGSLIIPEVGAHVWVFFEAGDFRYPVYWAGAPAMVSGTPDQPGAGQTDYPHNKVFGTKSGHLIELDDASGNLRIHIHHASGTDHLIDNEGSVTDMIVKDDTITIQGNSNVIISGNQTITITGNASLTASGNVTIAGASVEIN